jgi:hypothetical protein
LKRVRVEEQGAVGGGADEQRPDEEWFAPILVHEPAKDGREHELGERTRGREARESRRGQRRIAHDASDHHRARGEGGAEAEDREKSRWAEDLERVLGRCCIAALALGSHVCPPPKWHLLLARWPAAASAAVAPAAQQQLACWAPPTAALTHLADTRRHTHSRQQRCARSVQCACSFGARRPINIEPHSTGRFVENYVQLTML